MVFKKLLIIFFLYNNYDTFFELSHDFGQTFSAPKNISNNRLFIGNSWLLVTQDDEYWCLYLKLNNGKTIDDEFVISGDNLIILHNFELEKI